MSLVVINSLTSNSIVASSCKFKVPQGAKRILWQITNLCNYKCSYCIFASGPNKPKFELSTQRALKLVQEFAELGYLDLKLTGGEPLTRTDFSLIINAIKAAGISFDISTNASLLTEKKVEVLSLANPRYVHVSLDGPTQNVQEEIRGSNTYHQTLAGIKKLVVAGVRVRIGTVLYLGNQDLIAEMVEFAESLGVAEIVFSRMIPAGRLKNNSRLNCTISDAQASGAIATLRNRHSGSLKISSNFEGSTAYSCATCPGGDAFIYIDNQGHVLPCTWAYEAGLCGKAPLTLKNCSLRDLLRHKEIVNFRSQLSQSNTLGCPLDHTQFQEAR